MRRRDVAATLTLLTLLVTVGRPAQADPVYPSKNEVKRAQQHSAAVRSQVDDLQAQLARAAAKVEAADIALSAAAEDFDSARVELANSRRTAIAASAVAAKAGTRLDGAQQQVGRLAAQTYRSGGSLASLDVLLSPNGPGDVLERASMMQTLGAQRQRTVQRMDAARVVATTLKSQAAQALAEQAAAAAKLEKARAAAAQRATAARATLAAQRATRKVLLAKLAVAQRTTLSVEKARQAGLERVAAARRAAAQREAARQAARERDRSSNGSTGSNGSSGGSNSDSGGSGSGGSAGPAPESGSSSGSSSAGEQAVAWARQRIGLPYQWGGAGPGNFDCSGLTMRAWQQAGVSLSHSSRSQYQEVAKISYSELRPGDLVFFATNPSDPGTIHHVAMYIGSGQMIEAPYTGANVRIASLRHDGQMPYAGRP